MNNNFKKMYKRKNNFDKMHNFIDFDNKILIIGCGAVGTALLPIILKVININPKNIYIIDKNNNSFINILRYQKLGININNFELNKNNIEDIIINKLKFGKNDIIIDCSYKIDTTFMFRLCSKYNISYTNSSIEAWKDTKDNPTYYQKINEIEKINNEIKTKSNNFIISLGCNPGNVNIWTLYALTKINSITNNFNFNSYAELAQKMGLQVIHISEKDTQITNKPKKQNEYLNTWSSNYISWYDEAFNYLEINWGTHEKILPKNINIKLSNPHQKIIDKIACESFAKSYVPLSKNMMGMLIRHEECFTISRKLSLYDVNNNIIYKPSCYYVYKPCDSSINSLYEVKENDKYQTNYRLMTNDIIEGKDELGVTLFFSNGDIYWIGSLLDITEARLLYDNESNNIINATLVQVIAGYIGSLIYLIKSIKNNNYSGLLLPEDLPIKDFIEWTKPLLGHLVLSKITDCNIKCKDPNNMWQFDDFIIK